MPDATSVAVGITGGDVDSRVGERLLETTVDAMHSAGGLVFTRTSADPERDEGAGALRPPLLLDPEGQRLLRPVMRP